jgi:hypothetical protein
MVAIERIDGPFPVAGPIPPDACVPNRNTLSRAIVGTHGAAHVPRAVRGECEIAVRRLCVSRDIKGRS